MALIAATHAAAVLYVGWSNEPVSSAIVIPILIADIVAILGLVWLLSKVFGSHAR